MPTFLVPIEGLTTLADWKVGPVVRPAAEALNDARQGRTLRNVERFDRLVAEQASGAFVTVEAGDLDAAIDLVAQAVDVLRVLQHVRHFTVQLTQFGISGDIGRGVVPYIQIDGGQAGQGFSHRSNPVGGPSATLTSGPMRPYSSGPRAPSAPHHLTNRSVAC